jgi:hypothetical protein
LLKKLLKRKIATVFLIGLLGLFIRVSAGFEWNDFI